MAESKLLLSAIQNLIKARAKRGSSNQSVGSGSWTKVQLNTESYDPNNNFDSATNYRYTVPVTGYYQVNAGLHYDINATGGRWISIYKNGAAFCNGGGVNGVAAMESGYARVSDIMLLTATDYLELYFLQNSGGNLDIAASESSFLSVHLLSL